MSSAVFEGADQMESMDADESEVPWGMSVITEEFLKSVGTAVVSDEYGETPMDVSMLK